MEKQCKYLVVIRFSEKKSLNRWLFIITFLVLIPVFFIRCTSVTKEEQLSDTSPEEPEHYVFKNHSPEASYVGMQECKKCHRDKFDTYIHTQMGRSMKDASVSASSAQWDHQTPVYDKDLDFYYLPFSVKNEVFLKEFRLNSTGDTVHSRTEKLDVIVGSGQHTNSHFVTHSGYVYQAPLTWYAQKGEWHLPPGFEKGNNTRFARVIGEECMTCHNGYSEFTEGSRNKYISLAQGIDCERCHGPGSIHIAEKKSGKLVDITSETDYSIVNPAKLPPYLQMDVCQRCHLQGISVLKEGKSYKDFLPGQSLSSMHEVYQARFKDSATAFIMASHSDRLQMSKCYIASNSDSDTNNGLTCITCHNPHVSVTDVSSDYFNGKCMKCHQENKCTETVEKRFVKNDNCVDCHMKKASSYDIPHVNITDHFITRNPKSRSVDKAAVALSEDEKQKDFIRLYCRTNLQPSQLSNAKAYLNYFEKYAKNPALLDSAEIYLEKAETNKEHPDAVIRKYQIRLAFLRGDNESVIQIGMKDVSWDGWTAYRVGQAYMNSEQYSAAIEYFKKAVEQEPYNITFNNKLAKALIQDQRLEEAKSVLESTLTMNPMVAETNNQLGFCIVSMAMANNSSMIEAETYFLEALALNPDYTKAKENLASLYLNTGNKTAASQLIDELLRTDPENATYLKFKKVVDVL